ncbi:MAG TPA: integrin alpha, partial [Planctomycetota bacterium]|nr:integrin alpha [Planctomycetota bacterium]
MSPSPAGFRSAAGPRVLSTACAAFLLAAGASSQGYPVWESSGPSSDSQLGSSISATGDLDGDGLGDLLVGSVGITGGIFGPPGVARLHSGASGVVLFSFTNSQPFPGFGIAVSGVADTDGDGVRDLLVGAPLDAVNLPPLTGNVGRATLFSGATGLPLLTLSGTVAGGSFGASVAGVGDQNLDGYADVLVGAPGGSFPSTFSGEATIHSGFDGSVLLVLRGVSPG